MNGRTPLLAFVALMLCACAVPRVLVRGDLLWRYEVERDRRDATVVAVLEPDTLSQTYVYSSSLGGRNEYVVDVGSMTRAAVKHEFSRLFARHEIVSQYRDPGGSEPKATVVVSVPDYRFTDGAIAITLRARTYGERQTLLLDKTYHAVGSNEAQVLAKEQAKDAAKMAVMSFSLLASLAVEGGDVPTAMKTVIAESSRTAFQSIFAQMSGDLDPLLTALRTGGPSAARAVAAARDGAPGAPASLAAAVDDPEFFAVAARAPSAMKGGEFFLCCNLFLDGDGVATDANYLLDDDSGRVVLPPGTRVRIIEADDEQVGFVVSDSSGEYWLYFEYGTERIPAADFFSLIFRPSVPDSHRIDHLPTEIRDAIRAGRLLPGMTRQQTAQARGLPPFHQTAGVNATTWFYYDDGDVGHYVTFVDGRIASITASSTP